MRARPTQVVVLLSAPAISKFIFLEKDTHKKKERKDFY
jgi:hypothetical protein